MSMIRALAKVSVVVMAAKAVKADETSRKWLFAALNATGDDDARIATDRLMAGETEADIGLGDLLERLSAEARAVNDAPSDLDNLIGGLGEGPGPDTGQHPSFGQVLRSHFDSSPEAPIPPTADQEAAARLMLAAILQAARHVGLLGASETAALIHQLDDVSDKARAYVAEALDAPVPVTQLAQQVPPWLESQIYLMSVLGVHADHAGSADYLRDLAACLAVGRAGVNMVHDHLRVPRVDV